MSFSKTALLAALQATITTVEVDGFGALALRQITVAENDALRAASKADTPASEFGLRLVVASVVDDAGAQVLTAEDVQALRAASGAKVDKLVEAVLRINGYTRPDPASAEAKNTER